MVRFIHGSFTAQEMERQFERNALWDKVFHAVVFLVDSEGHWFFHAHLHSAYYFLRIKIAGSWSLRSALRGAVCVCRSSGRKGKRERERERAGIWRHLTWKHTHTALTIRSEDASLQVLFRKAGN